MDKMTKEHLTSLLINGTSEQIQEAIDDIHPADILDVLQDHHSQLNNILSKLPNDIIADVIEEEEDEDEQYEFYNTHEPIITQELWDSVQKRKKRANRTATKGTHSNRLSGYLYCADCGRRMTLQTHYSKKDRSVQYSYRCGG